NDIICGWNDDKEIAKIAKRYKPHLSIGILRPPQLFEKGNAEIDSNAPLTMANFVFEQLCSFTPGYAKDKEMTASEKKKVEEKEQAMYVVLYEYYKQNIIGENKKWKMTLQYHKHLKHIFH
ncbi:hypothetical protein RFI_36736, partial [Reticulomyxa filosa]